MSKIFDFEHGMMYDLIDYAGGSLYWVENKWGRIYSGNPDGTGATHLIDGYQILGLAVWHPTPKPASVFASLGLLTAAGCGLREWRRRKKKAA